MSYTPLHINIIYQVDRTDGDLFTGADLKKILKANKPIRSNLSGNYIESIQDDHVEIYGGSLNCHALITYMANGTPDEATEQAIADRLASSIVFPRVEGYTYQLLHAVAVSL